MKKILLYSSYALISICLLTLFILFCQQNKNITLDITLAAVIVTIVLFVSGIIMEYLTALIFLSLIMLLGIAPASVTFSGFTSEGFWLIFAGVPISMAIKKSGLVNRISASLMTYCKGSYAFLTTWMVLFGLLMAFIMPSGMGRVMLMVPILIEFAKANGFNHGSKGYTGLILAGVLSTYNAGFAILPSNLPNVILMGSMKSLYHLELIYTNYLYLHFPVLGIVKSILLIAVINWLFKDKPMTTPAAVKEHLKTKFTMPELRLTVYLVLVFIAWLSDSITHWSPAWPALIVAVICLLPVVGIINHKTFFTETNLAPLFYVAGLIGLSAIVSYTGLGVLLGQKLIALLPFAAGHNAMNFSLLTLTSILMGLITTLPGVPAIITPLSASMAHVTELPIMTVLMTQVIGFSTYFLPYQAPPVLIAMGLADIKLKDVTKLCLIMALLSIIVLLPVDYYWWKFLKM